MSNRVYIVMPVHNRRALTERYARCLAEQTHRDFHLVLVDDGSTDGTSDAVLAWVPDATVLRGRGHWWWAGGLQQGLDWLAHEGIADDALVLTTNDDLTIAPDFLARGVELMRARTRTLLCARIATPDGLGQEVGQRFDPVRLTFEPATTAAQVNCLPTQGLFVRWRDVREIGRFHPRLLPHYLSDYEWTIRAYRKGFRLETSDALLIDLEREATGYHTIPDRRFGAFVRKYFSIKSPRNPLHWSTFALFASPRRFLPRHLFAIWNHARHELQRAFADRHASPDRAVRL